VVVQSVAQGKFRFDFQRVRGDRVHVAVKAGVAYGECGRMEDRSQSMSLLRDDTLILSGNPEG